ncbi:MAG: M15 family metallopeptidase [Fusobacteriaceae bacterium]
MVIKLLVIQTLKMLKNITACETSGCAGLDKQLIAEMMSMSRHFGFIPKHPNIDVSGCLHPMLNLGAANSLIKMKKGKKLVINSAYRTIAQQFILWNNKSRCGMVAAFPGSSNHQSGLAIDIEDASYWRPYLEDLGWSWLGSFDAMHFDFAGESMKSLSIKAFQQLANKNGARLAVDGELGENTLFALRKAPEGGY